ncbi:MAG: hypothetical protein IKI21_04625 [Oscillospiraceae bacterium]|nr:hypothetical protein [Oscillospiraceae bacterium]
MIQDALHKIWQGHIKAQYSIASLAYLMLRRHPVRVPDGKRRQLFILVNGPSLAPAIESYGDRLREHELMCVNMMATTDDFARLRPHYYTIADIKFWQHMDEIDKNDFLREEQAKWDQISDALIEKTKWHMYLFLPDLAKKNTELVRRLASNRYLHPIYLNSGYDFQGFASLHYQCWEHQLCIPDLENVLVLCLYCGILMDFAELDIIGCDHTYFSGFSVDPQNRFFYEFKHYYDNGSSYKVPYDSYGKPYSVGRVLEEYAHLWQIYGMLRRFADRSGVRICNCTEPSMIDTFERRPLEEALR